MVQDINFRGYLVLLRVWGVPNAHMERAGSSVYGAIGMC